LSNGTHARNGQLKHLDQRSDHRVKVVYFLAVSEPGSDEMPIIKIGETGDYAKRLKQHMTPKFGREYVIEELCVVRGTKQCESQVHRYFEQHNLGVPGEKELFKAHADVVDYIRWLREQSFTWVPGDEQLPSIEATPHVAFDLWMPTPDRRREPPKQVGLFNELGALRLPPRELTTDDF